MQFITTYLLYSKNILENLDNKSDQRVAFIHEKLHDINNAIRKYNSSILVVYDRPLDAFSELNKVYQIQEIYANHDYEPYATDRDKQVEEFAKQHQINFRTFKDQVIFEKSEVMKPDESPYTIFTPYSKIWKQKYLECDTDSYSSEKLLSNLLKTEQLPFPSLKKIGFQETNSTVAKPKISEELIRNYSETRDIPGIEGTTHLGVHLRFGTVSVRQTAQIANRLNEQWPNELIWREFFMMILYHFPYVVNHNFKRKYDDIKWRNNEKEFECWCKGETGYPLVDAGMRQLNETGWMHNRVRMVVASFLCKHLLIDWRWGEAYFAEKLLDYELSSNNGNWQWAAGTGCDAAPYFRIFNPYEQLKKFDPKLVYVKRWIKDFKPGDLPEIVEHSFARKRALEVYKNALQE
ncbi:MAG TPA: deoxyribodipyrimidine photo-lyase [Hanamia sp.]